MALSEEAYAEIGKLKTVKNMKHVATPTKQGGFLHFK